jgi:hypothetical protein
MKSRNLIITHCSATATVHISITRSGGRFYSNYTPTAASLTRIARLLNIPTPQPSYSIVMRPDGMQIAYSM